MMPSPAWSSVTGPTTVLNHARLESNSGGVTDSAEDLGTNPALTFGVEELLRPGENCGAVVRANRFALLVDGSAYYEAVAESIRRARRTVIMLGWDLDSRVRLGPGADPEGGALQPPLRDFLPAVAEGNPNLDIYILTWDFSVLFANARDPELVWGRDPFKHPRVHLIFDGVHPPGGSHHQKIVVIDDCLAFAGGMDLAGGRWDTPEHLAHDERRAGKDQPYPPSHDVQAMVDGDAARELAAIARDRWRRATGKAIPDRLQEHDLWPDRVIPDLENVRLGISRTDVGPDGNGGCLEVERLHLDVIAAARQSIYIENQYLTSSTMVSALCRRLDEADGPEVLIVLPLNNTGWLEDHTIEVLRFRSLRRLREADRYGRLRICYPVVPGLDGDGVVVHSKILVADDRWFRVGSSNLTDRSMRLDTECDLTIEATSDLERRAISELRHRLLGEHLGMSASAVEAFLSHDASLIRLVDSRRTQPRSLRELPSDGPATSMLAVDAIVDPAGPITPGRVIEAIKATLLPKTQ